MVANAIHSFTTPFSFRFLCLIIHPPKNVPPPPAGTAIAPITWQTSCEKWLARTVIMQTEFFGVSVTEQLLGVVQKLAY